MAAGVYRMRKMDVAEAVASEKGIGISPSNDFDQQVSRFEGQSGFKIFGASRSGFGYIANGKGTRQNEVVISTRGTSVLSDWLTDAKIGIALTDGGYRVHVGFQDTYKSFRNSIKEWMASLGANRPSTVHCVGHSLGGALATLVASFVKSELNCDVKLYTFGCPRVLADVSGLFFTQKIGADNIFRCHHNGDPVTVIPHFPYFHVPLGSGRDYYLNSGHRFHKNTHSMAKYVKTVGDLSWNEVAAKSKVDSQDMMDKVINAAKNADVHPIGKGFMMFGAGAFWAIGKLLKKILQAVGHVISGSIFFAFTGAATVLDKLAFILRQAVNVSVKLGKRVRNLLGMMMQWMGRMMHGAWEVSTSVIRWILDLFASALRSLADGAIRMAHTMPDPTGMSSFMHWMTPPMD